MAGSVNTLTAILQYPALSPNWVQPIAEPYICDNWVTRISPKRVKRNTKAECGHSNGISCVILVSPQSMKTQYKSRLRAFPWKQLCYTDNVPKRVKPNTTAEWEHLPRYCCKACKPQYNTWRRAPVEQTLLPWYHLKAYKTQYKTTAGAPTETALLHWHRLKACKTQG